jgi:vitamin-K-epoxide reductase (warfarin-sensitive)
MRYVLVLIALIGIVDASMALHEHYRVGTSPCSINEKWDCGIVNHSPYAVMGGVPVAAIGIGGYLCLGVLAFRRAYGYGLTAALIGLGFSLYLANIEAHVLGVWCVYCAISLGIISLLTLFFVAAFIAKQVRRRRKLASLQQDSV